MYSALSGFFKPEKLELNFSTILKSKPKKKKVIPAHSSYLIHFWFALFKKKIRCFECYPAAEEFCCTSDSNTVYLLKIYLLETHINQIYSYLALCAMV